MRFIRPNNPLNNASARADKSINSIMVVDDSKFARNILCEILRSDGFRNIAEAKNGVEAIEVARDRKPKYIFLDVEMPMMDGLEAIPKILEADPEAYIIMCTAVAQKEIIADAVNAGAKDYVIKPYKKENILRVLKSIIESRKSEEEETDSLSGYDNNENKNIFEGREQDSSNSEDAEEGVIPGDTGNKSVFQMSINGSSQSEKYPEILLKAASIGIQEPEISQEIIDLLQMDIETEETVFGGEAGGAAADELGTKKSAAVAGEASATQEDIGVKDFEEKGTEAAGIELEGIELEDTEAEDTETTDIAGLKKSKEINNVFEIVNISNVEQAVEMEKAEELQEVSKPEAAAEITEAEELQEFSDTETAVEILKELNTPEDRALRELLEELADMEEAVNNNDSLNYRMEAENKNLNQSKDLNQSRDIETNTRQEDKQQAAYEEFLNSSSDYYTFAYLWRDRFGLRQEEAESAGQQGQKLPFQDVVSLINNRIFLPDTDQSGSSILSGLISTYLNPDNRLQPEESRFERQTDSYQDGIRLFTGEVLEGRTDGNKGIAMSDFLKFNPDQEQNRICIRRDTLSKTVLQLVQGKAERTLI